MRRAAAVNEPEFRSIEVYRHDSRPMRLFDFVGVLLAVPVAAIFGVLVRASR